MTTTWVVVAHQTSARIMEHRSGFGKNLFFVEELTNPDGRKRNHEIDADRAGEAFTGARGSAGRREMHPEHTAHEHVVESFVREIASHIARARAEGRFSDLILVAEPRFLGALRGALDAATSHTVKASVTKDLAAVTSGSIAKHISEVLPL